MKKNILIIAGFLMALTTFADDRQLIDSLKSTLYQTLTDSQKVRIYTDLTGLYQYIAPDSSIKYGNKCLALARKMNYKLGEANCYTNMAEAYSALGQQDTALYIYEKALDLFKAAGSERGIATGLMNIGLMHQRLGNFEHATDYFEQSIVMRDSLNELKGLSLSLNNLAINYARQGNYPVAADYFIRALKIDEELKDTVRIATRLNNIGLTYTYYKDYYNAAKYYHRAAPLHKKMKDTLGLARVMLNMGVLFYDQEKLDSAMHYFQIANDLYNKNLNGKGTVLNNIGQVYLDWKEYQKAIEYSLDALELRQKIQDKYGVSGTMMNIALAYFHLEEYEKSREYAEDGLKIAEKINATERKVRGYEVLAMLNKKLGNHAEAYEYLSKHMQYSDSLFNEENTRELTQLEMQYEFQKKQVADSVRHVEEKRIKDLEIAKQRATIRQERTFKYALFSGVSLLLLFIFILYRGYKQKQKNNKVLEHKNFQISHQKRMVEDKNKEILDSITYAKRIQSAILPPKKLVKSYLEHSFILYKPKDIVAGDFYWMETVESAGTLASPSALTPKEVEQSRGVQSIYFAAADCTGHGVPGAMVSVMCSNALTKCVKELGLNEPAQILDKTNEILEKRFERSEEEVKDGMDIALVSMKLENTGNKPQGSAITIQYAGANNPLWIISDKNHEHLKTLGKTTELEMPENTNFKLYEVKPDKQPIGKYEGRKPFTNHELQLQKGDSIYIFSDGYPDQFGGPKGKKFKYKPFKKLLLSIQEKPMTEQRAIIDDVFEKWKADYEQIDDVCIIGVKV